MLENFYDDTSAYFSIDPNGQVFKTDIGVAQGGVEAPPLFCLFIDFVMRVYENKLKLSNIAPLQLKFTIPEVACATDLSAFLECDVNLVSRDDAQVAITSYNLSASLKSDVYLVSSDALEANRSSRTKKPPDKSVTGENTEKWNGYADDTTLYQLNIQNLQKSLENIAKIYDRYKLYLNVGKTKTMVYGLSKDEDTPSTIIKLNGKNIENLSTFRFLGSMINDHQYSTGDIELNSGIQAAESKFAEYKKVRENHHLCLATRIKYYMVFIRSRLTYACQTWALTTAQYKRMDSAQHKFLRRMIKGGTTRVNKEDQDFRYRVTTEKLMKICNLQELSSFIKNQQQNKAKFCCKLKFSRELYLHTLFFPSLQLQLPDARTN